MENIRGFTCTVVHKCTLFAVLFINHFSAFLPRHPLILQLISNIKAFVSQQNAVIHSDMGPIPHPYPPGPQSHLHMRLTCEHPLSFPFCYIYLVWEAALWRGGAGVGQGLAATQISFRKEVLLKSLNDIFNALTALVRRVISVSRMFCVLSCRIYQAVGRKLRGKDYIVWRQKFYLNIRRVS